MKLKIAVVPLAILILAATFSAASAQPMRRHGWAGPGMGPGPRLEEFLNLTQEQKSKIEALRKAHQDEMKGIRDKLQDLQKQLREARQDPKADPKKIDGLIDEIFKLRASQMKSQIKHQGEMEKILTQEQKDKLAQARNRLQRMRLGPMGRPGLERMGRFGIWPWCLGGRFMGHPGAMMRLRWLPRWWR